MWNIIKKNGQVIRADTDTCLIVFLNTLNNEGKLADVDRIERISEVMTNEQRL